MANNTIYPYGTGGQLPSGIAIVNDLITGGADKALSAEMGKVLAETVGNDVVEDGIFFVDEYLNIGAMIDTDGFHAINTPELEDL